MPETKNRPFAVRLVEEQNQSPGSNVSVFCLFGPGLSIAQTMGASLRRTLLSSVPGVAVKAVRIHGASHELGCVEGVQEDVQQIILNLRKIVFSYDGDEEGHEDVFVSFDLDSQKEAIDGENPTEVFARDLSVGPSFSVSPGSGDVLIATVDPRCGFGFDILLGIGNGFVRAKDQVIPEALPEGWIPVDSSFSPVRRCASTAEPVFSDGGRWGERLVMEVETNGSISPREALGAAAGSLSKWYSELLSEVEGCSEEALSEEAARASVVLGVRVADLGLPPVLGERGIETLGDLVGFSEKDLLELPGIGKKKIESIKASLEVRGLSLKAD